MKIQSDLRPPKKLLFFNKNLYYLILNTIVFLLSCVVIIVGYYGSMPYLMVIGLFVIGILFIDILKRLSYKLIVMLLIFTCVPAVALLWPLVHHFHFQIVDTSTYRLDNVSRNYAIYIDNWLEQRKNDIFLIENNINMINSNERVLEQEDNINNLRNTLLQIKNSSSMYSELFILGRFNNVVVSTNQSKEGGFDSGMTNISLNQEPAFSNLTANSGKPEIYLSKSIRLNGEQFVIAIKYNLADFYKAFNSLKNPNRPESTMTISLVDDKGTYIFSTDQSFNKPLEQKIAGNLNKRLEAISNIELHYNNDKGIKTVGAYSQVKLTGWYVISEQAFNEIIYSVDKNLMNVLYILIINFVVAILIAVYFSKGITKPILKIRELATRGSLGDLSVQIEKENISFFEYREANETILAFNKLITTLNILKGSLEAKISEKTQLAEELRETNAELNAQQVELTYLNDTLKQTNTQLNSAYQDLKNAQTKLVQHEKMASLGMLVAGVAHEINNPLGAIFSNISIYESIIKKLENKASEDNEIKQIVNSIESVNHINTMACDRIIKIVKSLRSFARLDEADYKDANIHEGIENTLIILNHRIKNKVEVIKEFGNIPIIKCHPNQLNQVFMNILVNAIDSIKNKGKVWIKTYSENNNVYIKIKDNGIGMKGDYLDKIFDPGFTTKGVGVGTGLGLSIVYNIIEAHKGNIYVSSEEGKGTEFTIELPIQ